jgi:hypothetical protein
MNFEVENSDDEWGLGPESESESDEGSEEDLDDDSKMIQRVLRRTRMTTGMARFSYMNNYSTAQLK